MSCCRWILQIYTSLRAKGERGRLIYSIKLVSSITPINCLQPYQVGKDNDFPWSPSHLIPFSDGATHHDFHHAKVKGNYAGFFPWTDTAFGTLCPGYPEHLAARKKKG